eukprot:2194564-Rhodomonas_salina.3
MTGAWPRHAHAHAHATQRRNQGTNAQHPTSNRPSTNNVRTNNQQPTTNNQQPATSNQHPNNPNTEASWTSLYWFASKSSVDMAFTVRMLPSASVASPFAAPSAAKILRFRFCAPSNQLRHNTACRCRISFLRLDTTVPVYLRHGSSVATSITARPGAPFT